MWQFFSKNILQGSVASRLRCGAIFVSHFTENLLMSLPVKILKIS